MNFNRKKRKTGRKIGFFISFAFVAVIVVSGFLLVGGANKARENVIIEAGDFVPPAGAFFFGDSTPCDFITDVSVIDTKKTGSVKIELSAGGKIYESVLTIEDTVPPSGRGAELYLFGNSEIAAVDFLSEVRDATSVTCEFVTLPDLSVPGWQSAEIILTDEGGNTSIVRPRFYVFDVLEEILFEAGAEDSLKIEDFVQNYAESEFGDLTIVQDGEIDFSVPGSYAVTLKSGGYEIRSAVKIYDTTPPSGIGLNLYAFCECEITPEEFAADISDFSKVSVSFVKPPDLKMLGFQAVELILTDESGNTAEIGAGIYLFETVKELVFEAGTVLGVSEKDFTVNYTDSGSLSLVENGPINFFVPGSYAVTLKCGKYEQPAFVRIKDTAPPDADVKNCRTLKGRPIPADDFVYNITDISPVKVKYKTLPDFSAGGVQTAYIILEDAYGNTREYTAELTVETDNTPPVISGELDKRVIVGGTVSYRAGVSVKDDHDEDVQLEIDVKDVNLKLPGTYKIVYWAVDSSGNKSEVTGSLSVYEIDMDYVNGMADGILAKIITKNMDPRAKARAIYDFVAGKMRYSATNAAQEIAQRAYDAFGRGVGDCYTYMAAARVLLTRAGIENKTVKRIPEAQTPHFWNLVNTGDGWYHFDVCPTPGDVLTDDQKFMFTETQAKKYTKTITKRDHYYDYDKSEVPEVVK